MVMRSSGARRLIAAVVALAAGWLIHPHLLLTVIPAVLVLLVQACAGLGHSIQRRGGVAPLQWISLVQRREVRKLRRPKRTIQRRLEP